MMEDNVRKRIYIFIYINLYIYKFIHTHKTGSLCYIAKIDRTL